MHNFEEYEVWLGVIFAAIAIAVLVTVLMNRRRRIMLDKKERRILEAQRRNAKKWEALQKKNQKAQSRQDGDQPKP